MPSGDHRDQQKRKKQLRRYCSKFAIFFCSHFGLAIVSVAYVLVGAVVFKYIEAPHELDTRMIMFKARNRIKEYMWIVLRDNNTAVDLPVIREGLQEPWDDYKQT